MTMRIEVAPDDDAVRAADARRGRHRARVLGDRHRHRHPGGQAAPDLRGVPAGRRDDVAQVRRHRARPLDQPRDRAPARRRDPRRSREPGKGSTFTLYLPATYVAAGARRRRDGRALEARLDDLVREGEALVAEGTLAARAAAARARPRPGAAAPERGRRRPRRRAAGRPRRARSSRTTRRSRGTVLDGGARARLQGHRRAPRRLRPRARARVQARRDRPRHEPAGDGRLDGARPPQAPPRDAAHPRAHRVRAGDDGKTNALRAGAVAFLREADREGEPRRDARGDRRRSSTGASAACSSSRTTTTSGTAIVELVGVGRRRRGDGGRLERRGARSSSQTQAVRLHGARPEAAGDDRASSCSSS